MATLDEASKCPKCGFTGEADGPPRPSEKPGVKVLTFKCMNGRCQWYDTGWLVQQNADGSIPDPEETPRGRKQFDRPDSLLIAQNMEQVERYAGFIQTRSTER